MSLWGARDDGPLLRVVRGEPDAAQLAALLAVVTARPAPAAPAPTGTASAWVDLARRLRRPPHPGPGEWRRSALPR